MCRYALLLGIASLIGCVARSADPAPLASNDNPPVESSPEAPWVDDFSKVELHRESITIRAPGTSILLGPMPHEYQRMNNCGPTSVAMLLGYFGRSTSQQDVAAVLKGGPWDKNVSPHEIAAYFRQRGFEAMVRTNGDLELLMTLLANHIPVIVHQWLERPDDDLTGHYRIVLGFDRTKQVMIVHDSYLGPEIEIGYHDFDRWWRPFNRRYIVVYRPSDEDLVRSILDDDWDATLMHTRAAAIARQEIDALGDAYAWFNLGNAYLGLGRARDAVAAFEQAMQIGLPERMLWYQFGPFQAYLQAGRYQELLEASAPLVASHPELEELQYLRGMAYLGLGQHEVGMRSLRTALAHNPRFEPALDALKKLQLKPRDPPQ